MLSRTPVPATSTSSLKVMSPKEPAGAMYGSASLNAPLILKPRRPTLPDRFPLGRCWLPSPRKTYRTQPLIWSPPSSGGTSSVIRFTTPPMASLPYSTEAGPRTTSIRCSSFTSMIAGSSPKSC